MLVNHRECPSYFSDPSLAHVASPSCVDAFPLRDGVLPLGPAYPLSLQLLSWKHRCQLQHSNRISQKGPNLTRSSDSRANASASISSSSLSISLMVYALFGLPVTISHILDASSSRHLLDGGDSDSLRDRDRRRFGFVPELLFEFNGK